MKNLIKTNSMQNGLNNVEQENLNPCKNFQRKNYGLKKIGCQRVNHNTRGLPVILLNKKIMYSTKDIIEITKKRDKKH